MSMADYTINKDVFDVIFEIVGWLKSNETGVVIVWIEIKTSIKYSGSIGILRLNHHYRSYLLILV